MSLCCFDKRLNFFFTIRTASIWMPLRGPVDTVPLF